MEFFHPYKCPIITGTHWVFSSRTDPWPSWHLTSTPVTRLMWTKVGLQIPPFDPGRKPGKLGIAVKTYRGDDTMFLCFYVSICFIDVFIWNYVSWCLFVGLFASWVASLLVCLVLYLSTYLPIYLSIYLPIYLAIFPCISPLIHLCICLSINLYICLLSIYVSSIYVSIYLFVYLSMYWRSIYSFAS